MTDFKQCPFCGADTTAFVTGDCEYTTCETCLAEGPHCETTEEAARLWNTRATPPQSPSLSGEDVKRVAAIIRDYNPKPCGEGWPRNAAVAILAALQSSPTEEAAEDDLNSAEARLEMVRACLQGIVDGGSPVALAKAGLDLCDLTSEQRAEMRGEEAE